jgi:hypothetical protein
LIFAAAILLATTAAAGALDPNIKSRDEHSPVTLSNGTKVQDRAAATPLHLLPDQRNEIKAIVNQQHSDVDLSLKTTKPAANFQPAIGKKIPKQLKGQTLPKPLLSEIPALKEYLYLKFKDQALIVDPLNKKIVDIIPL